MSICYKYLLILLTIFLVAGCQAPSNRGEVSVKSPVAELTVPVEFGYGPRFSREFLLLKTFPEPLYLTAFQVKITDENGVEIRSAENPLDWWEVSWVNPERHGQLLGRHSRDSDIIVRLPGGEHLQFPDGFGLPVYSNEPLRFRGGWSVSAQELEKFGQVQAELTVSFLRASQLDSPVSPLICQTAWAGTLDPSEGYEPWMAQPDEPLTGQYLFAQEIEPVVVRWFQGPGVSELQSETKPAESARSAFHFSAESEVRRRTALGVNLYLPDVDWNEWPSDSR